MADILIRGMEMPRTVMTVSICSDGTMLDYLTGMYVGKAVALPPHGDLIDKGEIYSEAVELSGPITGDGWDNFGVYDLIKRQPVIVPSNKEESK